MNRNAVAVRGPMNLALVTGLVPVRSGNGAGAGPLALPYYGFNAPARNPGSSRQVSPAASFQLVPAVSAGSRNYSKQLNNAVQAIIMRLGASQASARKSVLQAYTRNWLNINLPVFITTNSGKGWAVWLKLIHSNKSSRLTNNNNKSRKRTALTQLAIKSRQNNKRR